MKVLLHQLVAGVRRKFS